MRFTPDLQDWEATVLKGNAFRAGNMTGVRSKPLNLAVVSVIKSVN